MKVDTLDTNPYVAGVQFLVSSAWTISQIVIGAIKLNAYCTNEMLAFVPVLALNSSTTPHMFSLTSAST